MDDTNQTDAQPEAHVEITRQIDEIRHACDRVEHRLAQIDECETDRAAAGLTLAVSDALAALHTVLERLHGDPSREPEADSD